MPTDNVCYVKMSSSISDLYMMLTESVASAVLWFLGAIFTAYIDRASIVEGQLQLLSMRAMASYR